MEHGDFLAVDHLKAGNRFQRMLCWCQNVHGGLCMPHLSLVFTVWDFKFHPRCKMLLLLSSMSLDGSQKKWELPNREPKKSSKILQIHHSAVLGTILVDGFFRFLCAIPFRWLIAAFCVAPLQSGTTFEGPSGHPVKHMAYLCWETHVGITPSLWKWPFLLLRPSFSDIPKCHITFVIHTYIYRYISHRISPLCPIRITIFIRGARNSLPPSFFAAMVPLMRKEGGCFWGEKGETWVWHQPYCTSIYIYIYVVCMYVM